VPLGKYVDIDNSLWFERLKRERVEYRNGLKNVKLKATVKLINASVEAHIKRGSSDLDVAEEPLNRSASVLILAYGVVPGSVEGGGEGAVPSLRLSLGGSDGCVLDGRESLLPASGDVESGEAVVSSGDG
jgi:hypothetical protein